MVEYSYMDYYIIYANMRYGNTYKSYPHTIPINKKALHYTKIKELQVRMMKWSAWVKDEHIPNKELDTNKWRHRFTFTLKCQKRAGKLTKEELQQLNRYWKIYEERL